MQDAGSTPAAPVMAKEADFGGDIRLNRQLIMRAVVGAMSMPYKGVDPAAGLIPAFTTAEQISQHFTEALIGRAEALQAVVQRKAAERNGCPLIVVEVEGQEVEGEGAPFEAIVIMGTMPAGAAADVQAQTRNGLERIAGIVEASSEFARLLLESAIIEARADGGPGSGVIVAIRKLEVGHKINADTQKVGAVVRLVASVMSEAEPRISYLMGTAWGEPKAHQLGWEIPLVEYLYGPERLRWMDRRTVGLLDGMGGTEPERKLVVPS